MEELKPCWKAVVEPAPPICKFFDGDCFEVIDPWGCWIWDEEDPCGICPLVKWNTRTPEAL